MRFANKFDKIIINKNLDQALKEAEKIVREFLSN
jgi:guanylate kinase